MNVNVSFENYYLMMNPNRGVDLMMVTIVQLKISRQKKKKNKEKDQKDLLDRSGNG